METKPFTPNVTETEKKDGKGMSKDAKLAGAGVLGAAGIVGTGVLVDALTGEHGDEEIAEIISDPVEDVSDPIIEEPVDPTEITDNIVSDPVDPTDVTISDPIYANNGGEEAADVIDIAQADEDLNDIIEEILAIEEVEPEDVDLADISSFEEVGIMYTETGDEVIASDMSEDMMVVDVENDLAMEDVDSLLTGFDTEEVPEIDVYPADLADYGTDVDSLDFSNDFV